MITALAAGLLLWAALSTGATVLFAAIARGLRRLARAACPDHPPVDVPSVPLSATERATFARLTGGAR